MIYVMMTDRWNEKSFFEWSVTQYHLLGAC